MLKGIRLTDVDIHTRFLAFFSVLVPFELDMLPVFFMWMGFWLLSGEYKSFSFSRFCRWSAVLFLFFLLHLAGFLYSSNTEAAWMDLRFKVSLLFLPLLLSTYHITRQKLYIILGFFFLSCLAIALTMLTRNFLLSLFHFRAPYTYRHFCVFIHPSYFAMYQCWALLIYFCIPLRFGKTDLKRGLFQFLIPLVFVLSILFASSKSGLLGLVLTLSIAFAWLVLQGRENLKRALLFVFVGLLLAALFTALITTSPLNRFKMAAATVLQPEHVDCSSRESTAMRLLVWQSSFEIIGKHPLFGVGTGDINDELQRSYTDHGFQYPLFYKLNSHSQYLESAIMLGLPGLLAVLFLTIGSLVTAFRRKELLLLLFSVLITVNFLVESMLFQPGACTFFAFFLVLLLKRDEKSAFETVYVKISEKKRTREIVAQPVEI